MNAPTCPICGGENVKAKGEYSLFPKTHGLFLWKPQLLFCFTCGHAWEPTMEQLDYLTEVIEKLEDKVNWPTAAK